MNTFWLKIAGFAVVVLIGAVLLINFLSSGIEEATDFERAEKLAQVQEAKLQAELAEAERRAEQAKAKRADIERPSRRAEQFGPELTAEGLPQPQVDEIEELEQSVQAQRLYQMAETEFKIARKPFMSYKRCVDYCRQIIQKWPDSAEAAKARVLLRKIPERHRKRYNITDEEMGL